MPETNVFKNENATTDQLRDTFIFFEQKEDELRGELEITGKKLAGLHQDSLLSGEVSHSLKQTRERYQDLLLQISACGNARGQLLRRLEARLPLEANAEINVIQNEVMPKLKEERAELLKEYAAIVALAVVLEESLNGMTDKSYPRDFGGIAQCFRIEGEYGYLIEKIGEARKARGTGESNQDKGQAAYKRREGLKTILREPDKAVRDLLRKAGAKAFQPKPKETRPEMLPPGESDLGGRVYDDPVAKLGLAVYSGYQEAPLPRIEHPKCWTEGHDFHEVPGQGRICSRCGDPDRNQDIERRVAR